MRVPHSPSPVPPAVHSLLDDQTPLLGIPELRFALCDHFLLCLLAESESVIFFSPAPLHSDDRFLLSVLAPLLNRSLPCLWKPPNSPLGSHCSFLREGRNLYYGYSACPRTVRLSSGARPLKPVCIQYVPVIQPR